VVIDTLTQTAIARIPIGQAPQAVVYVPNAAPDGSGTTNLEPLGFAGRTTISSSGRLDLYARALARRACRYSIKA
jgi:hypothetical protein